MSISHVLQELFRPTPSTILPLEKRNINVKMPSNQKDIIMSTITKTFLPGEKISTRTLQVDGLKQTSVKNGMAELAAEGRLIRIGVGIYCLP